MDYSALKGIPIDYLVSSPLLASARGNKALAEVNLDCFLRLAFADGTGKKSDPRLLTFKLQRPYQEQIEVPAVPGQPDADPPVAAVPATSKTGDWKMQELEVQAPCAALLPLPALLVDKISIDFTTSMSNESSTTVSAGAEVSASGGAFGFTFSAKVTTNVENTRSSKQECTYTFHVEASQYPQAEGMSKLCDIFASVIEPLPKTT